MRWAQWKKPKLYMMLFGDATLFMVAHAAAYLIRFEFEISPQSLEQMTSAVCFLVPMKLAIFYFFGLYRGMWRYTSLGDFWRLAQASAVSTLVVVTAMVFLQEADHIPRSVILLDGVLSFLLAGGLRMGIRTYYAMKSRTAVFHCFYIPGMSMRQQRCKRVLIIGAGDAGEKILRETLDNPHLYYLVVGFLDDDPDKRGRCVHSVPILGSVEELCQVIQKNDIEEVLIAIPSATGAEMRYILSACRDCNVTYKTLPGIGEIIDGKVDIKRLRDVNYEDLLGRETVQIDTSEISGYLTNQTVLISGCGGSIGSELCRQVVRYRPAELLLLDASEANLYQIQMELHNELHFRGYRTILGQVQNQQLMEDVFCKYRPHVVFHAAAYKHVPMLEKNPWQAVSNNVLGSWVAMEMAAKYEVERFVLVSTDKAVRPTNVMGASKRVTELLLQTLQGTKTRFMAVRFGNVVGSSGSVIPLFQRQIERGGPVTVTHPEVCRYLMTIPEAARLILQAGAMGEGGEVFILKMGTPVKIVELARDLIRLSGKEPGKDIEITFTGLREGEKLYEELITVGEGIVETKHDKIMVLKANGNGYRGPVDSKTVTCQKARELCEMIEWRDGWVIKQKLHEIVSEYTPQETDYVL